MPFPMIGKKVLHTVFKPLIWPLLRRKAGDFEGFRANLGVRDGSEMVGQFNVFHNIIFKPFFNRVDFLEEDVQKIKALSTPTVFLCKNKGQIEYRYFNQLFLTKKLELSAFSSQNNTFFWRPFKEQFKLFALALYEFFKQDRLEDAPSKNHFDYLQKNKSVFLNLQINRDYLFGLIKTNPLSVLEPLVDWQKEHEQNVNIVTVQFMYDKHPDKVEQSYFDLLFGPKSQPGAIRKALLFVMNYFRKPRVTFGNPIALKEFLNEHPEQTATELLKNVENDLAIEKTRITGPSVESKEKLISRLLNSPKLMDEAQAYAAEHKMPIEKVNKKLSKYFKEIGADINYSYVHFVHLTLRFVWNRIFNGVVVKQDQLKKVREQAGEKPIVLVPMHRSHIDYLLISDLFYEHNITFPHIVAGINMNFWPFGILVRKCGGFFIRRTFKGKDLYKMALSHYIHGLIESGHCLEFFIEGTRSRTGKMLSPKMGIMSYILKAYQNGASQDVTFVPIAINYEQVLEQKAYQSEQKGKDKKKESFFQLLKAGKVIKNKYGKVYIEFADPIPLKQMLQERGLNLDTEAGFKKAVSECAYDLTCRMNKAAMVTPISLVSLALLSWTQETFEWEEVLQSLKSFKAYLDFKGVTYTDLINFSEDFAYTEAFKMIKDKGYVEEKEAFGKTFYQIKPEARKDLDYYKNSVMHFFVSLSLYNLSHKLDHANTSQKFKALKPLLDQDFMFSRRMDVEEHINKILVYLTDNDFDETLKMQSIHLIRNFFETHLITLFYLSSKKTGKKDVKSAIKEILVLIKEAKHPFDLKCPEALNQSYFKTSLLAFQNLGVLVLDDKGAIDFSKTDQGTLNVWIEEVKAILSLETTQKHPLRPLSSQNLTI